MMSRVLPVVVAVVLGLFAGAAHATVGGKETVELLGYEPVDGKVYWLEHSHRRHERPGRTIRTA